MREGYEAQRMKAEHDAREEMPDPKKPREFIVIPIPEGWYGERILADMKDDWKDEYADTLLVPAIREAFIDSACLVRREGGARCLGE